MKFLSKHLIIPTLLLFVIIVANAQTSILKKEKLIFLDSLTIKVDSLSIYPNSFVIKSIDQYQYDFDYISATLYIKDSTLLGKSILCSYQCFNIDFSQKINHKSVQLISRKGNVYKPEILNLNSSIFDPSYNESSLQTNGSIIRGVSVGNNQDFVLNSALNIQLSGFLAPDIEIKANITDKNIPVQPEGNTRVIQDFDKIFISLNYKNRFFVNGGDIDILKPNSHFINLSKRMIGMELAFNQIGNKNITWQTKTGGGVSKGRYAKQKINPVNGRQGPYKLNGNLTISNIIILSGSERVYVDNKLLIRGLDNDYVIDYNIGEITFTAKMLITSDKEINVEYEYSDLSYSRYYLYSFNQIKNEKNPKWTITCNFYQEKDLKNSSIQPELTDSMKWYLSGLSDQDQPYYTGIDTSSFYPGEILYAAKDTIVNQQTYHIYYYSVDQTQSLYRVNMSWMGDNNGNYIMISSGSNGRVFAWVAPVNNVKQGNYEPVIKLNKPESKQIGTIGATYEVSKSLMFNTEFSFSNYDRNLFSDLDESNNLGFAYLLDLIYSKTFYRQDSTKSLWNIKSNLSFEMIQKNFSPVESYRSIEFYKDYNLGDGYAPSNNEMMLTFNTSASNRKYGETSYTLNFYNIKNYLTSWRNQLHSLTRLGSYTYSTQTSFLYNDDPINKSQYLRTINTFSKTFTRTEWGIYERFERNMFTDKIVFQLQNNSYQYNEAYLYLKNNDSIRYKYQVLFKNSIKDKVEDFQIKRDQVAYDLQGTFDLNITETQMIKSSAVYRKSFQKDTIGKLFSEDFFVGSLEYVGRFLKNAIILNTYYEAGSGLEQKKIYSFIKVATGQGTHVWNDYNNNNIEELNEFEIAVFQNEANYIKIWITSNDYIYTFNNALMQSIQIRPASIWGNRKGFLHFLSHWNNSTLIRLNQKNTKEELGQALNPFFISANDTMIMTSNIIVNNTVSYNPSQKWGIDYYYKFIQNKNLLYYGPEVTQQEFHELMLRVKPTKRLIFKTRFSKGNKINNSTFFNTNNFNLRLMSLKLESEVQIADQVNLDLSYQYKWKQNLSGDQKLTGNEVELVLDYRIPRKGTLSAKGKYVYFFSKQNIEGNLGYEMLEGLGLGKNATWTLLYQFQVSEYLLIDFQYNGRTSEKSRTIHNGTLQLKVIF